MEIRNTSNNTIYAPDVDFYLAYKDGQTEVLSPDMLKKSKSLRGFIINGMIEIVNYDPNERIEASIAYLQNQANRNSEIDKKETASVEQLSLVSNDIEVKIHGIFYDAGGYGKVNRNLALKLHESGIKVRIDPKNSRNQLRESELSKIITLTKTSISKNHISIDSVIPSFGELSTGKYKILYTTIESYTIPKQFLECCQFYNEIWVTSPWSAKILKKNIDKPIYVIPAGVEESLYVESGPKFDLKPNIKDFVFISVFGWGYRKGYDVLLKAYFDEFNSQDNVSLLIVSRYQNSISRFHKDKIRDDINKIMDHFPNKEMPHVVRYSRVVPEEDMPKLYRAADCFVLVPRGEGSCLPPVEASLCGLPIIMTNASGQQMYLRNNNSYMIDIDRLVKMRPEQIKIHYWSGQEFPDLTSEKVHNQVKKTMRHVYENIDEAKIKNKRMQNLIKQNFTWTHTANAAISRLKTIKQEMQK